MIPNRIIESFTKSLKIEANMSPGALTPDEVRVAFAKVEGALEQNYANETVREMQRRGVCPTCGADA